MNLKDSNSPLTRRRFSQMMVAAAGFAFAPHVFGEPTTEPAMLVTPKDPFSGLDLLHARYLAGARPSNDISGLSLSWLLTGDKSFADKALGEMVTTGMPAKPSSANWVQYANWALAYDWLYQYRDFDSKLKDRFATQFADVAADMIARPELNPPAQTSFQNYPTRYLGLAVFALCAASKHGTQDPRIADLKLKTVIAFRNILQLTDLVTPCGSDHESMDYMRISYLPWRCSRSCSERPLEWTRRADSACTPILEIPISTSCCRTGRLREKEIMSTRFWTLGILWRWVMRFIALKTHMRRGYYATAASRFETGRSRCWIFYGTIQMSFPAIPVRPSQGRFPFAGIFRGVDQVVFRSGWSSGGTRIEFDCGPYFAKHQHLDRAHFTIHHRGHLAIDSGADYTESESPHYLNYYRRTVAHNSMLVYDPAEKFFWSENILEAANDGGQRMDSSRFWNTVRSLEDWEKTRDIWDIGRMRIVDASSKYNYALGDATRAYSPAKVSCFTRQLLYLPALDVLLVFDRVVSTDPAFRKTWLLHAVNKPSVEGQSAGNIGNGGEEFQNAPRFRFQEGEGEILVHTLLPATHSTTRRGGPGYEFWTPGDSVGGAWGTGRNWPLEPAEGGPLPTEPDLRAMWKTFWGADYDRIERSNHKNVIPGAWRIEVTPSKPAKEDLFLHAIEIGDRGKTGNVKVELLAGSNIVGAACSGIAAFFSSTNSPIDDAECDLPGEPNNTLWFGGLHANRHYTIEFAGSNLPNSAPSGIPLVSRNIVANDNGIAFLEGSFPAASRMRIHSATSA